MEFSRNKEDVQEVAEVREQTGQSLSTESLERFDEIMGDDTVTEVDDYGSIYKEQGELLGNTEYTIKGNTYKTDEYGRKVEMEAEPVYTTGEPRNLKEQKQSGGEERQENDDGGHIVAKILGGAEGEENLVPMRRTINRGDYKKMENEIAKALQDGEKVELHVDLEYEGESQRPSKFQAEYTISDKRMLIDFDNEENSIDLLDVLSSKIQEQEFQSITKEIAEMKADGIEATITSIKTEYDADGHVSRVTVGVLDESDGTKTYKVYEENLV